MYALKTQKVPGFNHLLATHGFAFAKTDRTIIREAIEWADVVHMMMNFPMEKACTQICKELHKPMTTAFHVQMENITSQFNWGTCAGSIKRSTAISTATSTATIISYIAQVNL